MGFGFRFYGFGFRVWGLGFKAFCLGFRVEFMKPPEIQKVVGLVGLRAQGSGPRSPKAQKPVLNPWISLQPPNQS